MSILKVLPLIYLMVNACALRLTGLAGLDPQQVKEIYENCVCPTESPTIINSLDSDHSGVERLVVFVYKKPDTGEIISFIPQKEHQRKIPDFPDTYGHIHKDQNPSIRDIFQISPSKDIREHKTHVEPVQHEAQHESNEGKENSVVPDDKITDDVNFNEQQSNTDIKIPSWHMSHDQNEVKPENIESYPLQISENVDKKTDIINEIDMKIPKWQMQINNKVVPENDYKVTKFVIDGIGMKNPELPMQLDGIKVTPAHFISHPNDHKNTEMMIDNSGIKIPEWPMQVDEIKVKPEHFITHSPDHKNTEMMIDNIGMKIPEFPVQLDGIKVTPAHFISHPNDHRNTEMIIDNSGIKIPEWPMQVDEIKVKPEHFISHSPDHKNIEMIDNIEMKIPEFPTQLDEIKVTPEHFISHPNDHKNKEMIIDNSGIKIPEWPMQVDEIKVKPEHFISHSPDHKNIEMIDNIQMKIPEFPMQLDGIKVTPEHFISHPNDHKNTEMIIDNSGIKIPEWPMQVDEIKVKPEHFISHSPDHKNTEMIDNIEMKIPEFPMQLDGIKVTPEHFISHPNDHKYTELMIDNSGMKIPEWLQLDEIKVKPEHLISHSNHHKNTKMIIDNIGMEIPQFPVQLDGIKAKPWHFISRPNDHRNPRIMINNIGMKIPEWSMQLDGIKAKPEHFLSHPNDDKDIEMMIDNSGIKIPEFPMQLDGIKVKPGRIISHPNDHSNAEITIDNSGMKIPEWPMQVDKIKVKPEHFISHPNDHKKAEIIIDNIGMKLPELQMQIDQNSVKPEHFISYPQQISEEYDHKKPEIVIDTESKIPKMQILLDENNVKPETFSSYPNDQQKPEIIIEETGIKVPKLQMELDENKLNPASINLQLVPGGNDQTKTEIVIDNIKPPTQDVSLEIRPVSGEEHPDSREKNDASVQPLINNDLNLDNPSIDSSLMYSSEPQNLFEESSPEHTSPGGIETIWYKKPESLDEPNQSIHIRPPPTKIFRFSEGKEVKIPTFQRMKVPRRDKYGRIIGWAYKTIKTYWKGGSRIPNRWDKFRINRYKPFNYHNQYIEDPGFNHWLREQLRITTLNGNRIPTSTADIIALDRAIRNVLLQNGWVVTGEGTLLDGSGRTSSLENLKLRPILVGKTFSYDRFMKQSTHEYTTSSKVPYLEGLLLTMLEPAKILGIVPLSISPHKHHAETSANGRSSKAGKSLLRVLPIEELVSFRKDSQKTKTKKPKSSKDKSKDAALLRQALSEIQQPQYAKGSLTTLKQRKGKVTHRDFGKFGTHRIITPEMPEWRIIGGNSATSSGTPLEWKGRSGLNG